MASGPKNNERSLAVSFYRKKNSSVTKSNSLLFLLSALSLSLLCALQYYIGYLLQQQLVPSLALLASKLASNNKNSSTASNCFAKDYCYKNYIRVQASLAEAAAAWLVRFGESSLASRAEKSVKCLLAY